MVTLFVDDLDQLTILEYLLYIHNIDHDIKRNDGRFGMKSPYITVYGAPLDEKRAMKWIRSKKGDCDCE